MVGRLADMIGKALAGLLMVLALAVVASPVMATPLPVTVHSPLEPAPASRGHQVFLMSVMQQTRTAPCSCPGCMDGPSRCIGMSCSAAAAQVMARYAIPSPLLLPGPVAFLTALAEPYAGTNAKPTLPPPRPQV